MKDIIVIGAGVVGCSIAQALSKFDCSVLVLEGGNDLSVGTSKANSGIVHAGYDAKFGTNKAKFNVLGNAMFDKLSADLDFPFKRNGSLVLCFEKENLFELENLKANGEKNGVSGLEILSAKEVLDLEPNINKAVAGALLAKTGGIVSPYEMTVALAENSFENGVEFEFNAHVDDVKKQGDKFVLTTSDKKVFESKVVINASGLYADEINNMISENKLEIVPRKGDYMLLDKSYSNLAKYTLFQLPTKMGKGILVTPTAHGNILIGPTAKDMTDKEDKNTTKAELDEAFEQALLTMPSLTRKGIITAFSGLRAHATNNDFTIGESEVTGFFNACGIESPGLTSAPAIGLELANLVKEKLSLKEKENFVEKRKGIPHFASLSNEERAKLAKENPLYGNIVCRCEMVTEGEIVDSIRRPLGARDTDGVKRRTRAGMGRCQAGFCTSKVIEILARELEIDMTEVTKCGEGSNYIVGRTK